MIKATDFIKVKKSTVYVSGSGQEYASVTAACRDTVRKIYDPIVLNILEQKQIKDWNEEYCEIKNEFARKVEKLTYRLEREITRQKKKPKYIILYGSNDLTIVDIYMLPMDIGITEKPEDIIYENAVFESREEAEYIASHQMLECYIIVEVMYE